MAGFVASQSPTLPLEIARLSCRAQELGPQPRLSSEPAPLHPAPSAQALSGQWSRVRNSLGEVVKFDGMLLDLETAVDNSFHSGGKRSRYLDAVSAILGELRQKA